MLNTQQKAAFAAPTKKLRKRAPHKKDWGVLWAAKFSSPPRPVTLLIKVHRGAVGLRGVLKYATPFGHVPRGAGEPCKTEGSARNTREGGVFGCAVLALLCVRLCCFDWAANAGLPICSELIHCPLKSSDTTISCSYTNFISI